MIAIRIAFGEDPRKAAAALRKEWLPALAKAGRHLETVEFCALAIAALQSEDPDAAKWFQEQSEKALKAAAEPPKIDVPRPEAAAPEAGGDGQPPGGGPAAEAREPTPAERIKALLKAKEFDEAAAAMRTALLDDPAGTVGQLRGGWLDALNKAGRHREAADLAFQAVQASQGDAGAFEYFSQQRDRANELAAGASVPPAEAAPAAEPAPNAPPAAGGAPPRGEARPPAGSAGPKPAAPGPKPTPLPEVAEIDGLLKGKKHDEAVAAIGRFLPANPAGALEPLQKKWLPALTKAKRYDDATSLADQGAMQARARGETSAAEALEALRESAKSLKAGVKPPVPPKPAGDAQPKPTPKPPKPKSPSPAIDQLLKEKKYDEASTAIRSLLVTDAKAAASGLADFGWLKALESGKRYDDAAALAEQAANAMGGEDPKLLVALQGRRDQARVQLARVRNVELKSKIDGLFKDNRLDEAVAAIREALPRDPQFVADQLKGGWLAALLKAQRYEDVAALSGQASAALASDPTRLRDVGQRKAAAEVAAGRAKVEAALKDQRYDAAAAEAQALLRAHPQPAAESITTRWLPALMKAQRYEDAATLAALAGAIASDGDARMRGLHDVRVKAVMAIVKPKLDAAMKAGEYERAATLAAQGMVALADDSPSVSWLAEQRVRAVLALVKPPLPPGADPASQPAVSAAAAAQWSLPLLSAAKQYYNVVLAEQTPVAISLLAEALAAARPDDPGLAARFKLQQLSGARYDLQRSPLEANASRLGTVLDQLPVELSQVREALQGLGTEQSVLLLPVGFDSGRLRTPLHGPAGLREIAETVTQRVGRGDYYSLVALGNLLLLADCPREARQAFAAAYAVAPASKLAAATEDVVRALRAEDGSVGRANAWILAIRPPASQPVVR